MNSEASAAPWLCWPWREPVTAPWSCPRGTRVTGMALRMGYPAPVTGAQRMRTDGPAGAGDPGSAGDVAVHRATVHAVRRRPVCTSSVNRAAYRPAVGFAEQFGDLHGRQVRGLHGVDPGPPDGRCRIDQPGRAFIFRPPSSFAQLRGGQGVTANGRDFCAGLGCHEHRSAIDHRNRQPADQVASARRKRDRQRG